MVCGDLHDTKANIRGECIKSILDVFSALLVPSFTLVANHDRINEKSSNHSLEFLRHVTTLIETPIYLEYIKPRSLDEPNWPKMNLHLIPYYHDVTELRSYLKTLPPKSTLIMHQGIQGSNAGEYFQDKSALRPEDVAGFRVISGHYHNRQTIDLPDGGRWDYVGNPFTLNFAEANDPPKGFQILYDDGSLEFVPTNLRKHIKIDVKVGDLSSDKTPLWQYEYNDGDIIWVNVSGYKEYLTGLTKTHVAKDLDLPSDFKLTFEPIEQVSDKSTAPVSQTKEHVLDGLIDSLSNTTVIQKQRLKAIWRDFT